MCGRPELGGAGGWTPNYDVEQLVLSQDFLRGYVEAIDILVVSCDLMVG